MELAIGRLKRGKRRKGVEVIDKASVNGALEDFGNETEARDRAAAGEIINRKRVFLVKGSENGMFEGMRKVDSEMERLMRVVIGKMRTSRQDLRREVGMKSREQVALEEDKIAERTSAVVAGRKEKGKKGGGGGGGVGGGR